MSLESRQSTSRAGATGTMHLPPADENNMVHKKGEPQDAFQRPNTGRNTRLGKKVEKPRDPKSGGPSGQKDRARHDKRHANK
jgi:hypothetical protein